MANTTFFPLYDRIAVKRPTHRALDITILFLLISLLVYRLKSIHQLEFTWILAFLCESFFTIIWVLIVIAKWNPVEHKTYPERLSQWVQELPPVDAFVTTADPVLEPPIITVNTVLSVLALDYPADKLACYVSDDGCSALTFCALVEASKFAKLWVPFCKKYKIQCRAPFMFFSSTGGISSPGDHNSLEFHQECRKIRDEYQELVRKIEHSPEKSIRFDQGGDLAVFSKAERSNHPSIIKVLCQNKGGPDGWPHLIYVSREKQPKCPHHYKAGAMNVLTRVSGMMTNAPFMLNLDCDMFANNPQIVRHAMCLLLGSQDERESGFVQSPQYFYDALQGHPLPVLQKYLGGGMVGIQGPPYGGTGCFHRRKVIYGLSPDGVADEAKSLTSVDGALPDEKLLQIFGNSKEFIKSAAYALQGRTQDKEKRLLNLAEEAIHVASCGYESGTGWGTEVGWLYGSTAEDILTGLVIHARGWRSLYCTPEPLPFLGCASSGAPELMTQQKRWATGLLEILISTRSPIFGYFTGKLQLRQCLAYIAFFTWGIGSVPQLCYAVLPAYCLITNSYFLPKGGEPAMQLYIGLFVIYNFYTLLEYLGAGMSTTAWFINQMMARIVATNAFLFGFFSMIFKILRISDTVFEVTAKSQSTSSDDCGDAGQFTFDRSPVFVPGTTLVLVHITALVVYFLGLQPSPKDGRGSGKAEIVGSIMVLVCFWPFVQGLFLKGKYGIPFATICKSTLLALLFFYTCAPGLLRN